MNETTISKIRVITADESSDKYFATDTQYITHGNDGALLSSVITSLENAITDINDKVFFGSASATFSSIDETFINSLFSTTE